ncbi:MAG: alpha/beta fold hydrolase [Methylobacterium mesophilicum]|nr:alpha/beta fold hydrolase [Methylobacterium mesophilicum]
MAAEEGLAFVENEGFELAFIDLNAASGNEPILLIHGFASTHFVNWVAPSWTTTLTGAGYRVMAFDNRGHGSSSKSSRPEDYEPARMAADAVVLLDRLGIERAHVMGYSMGARVSAFMALAAPDRVATLILGGLGIGLVEGVGDWDPISDALLAADAATVPEGRPRMFRNFADQTRSDRSALAACIAGSRTLLPADEAKRIVQPTLIGVGTRDDIAGDPEALATLMPNAESFPIANRDHMLAVGDRTFKAKALEFLRAHPI